MEILNTVHNLRSGNRHLTITIGEDSVDIRITKYARKDPINAMEEEIVVEDLNIPVSLDTYYKLVNVMAKPVRSGD